MLPPPSQDETVQHVVEILLAGYAIDKTAHMLAAIIPGISAKTFIAAISNSGGMDGHSAHARLERFSLDPDTHGAEVARGAARSELFYRAAYIVHAAERIEKDVASGKPVSKAVLDESKVFRSHEAARRGRMEAAAAVGVAANRFGPLLGWYLDPLLNNEPECIAANGNNFYAAEGTIIGHPGAVHLNCGCSAGPPHEGAGMVNDAVAAAREVIFAKPRKYGLRKAS